MLFKSDYREHSYGNGTLREDSMPKVVDFDKIREDLLYKSSRMIKKQGFLEMSMRDIASNLGVTTGKLYHYFRNKDEFLLELFEWISQKSIYELVKGICSVRDQKEKIHDREGFL